MPTHSPIMQPMMEVRAVCLHQRKLLHKGLPIGAVFSIETWYIRAQALAWLLGFKGTTKHSVKAKPILRYAAS
jgi:hypothetical protein